jgi:pilus assembly protein Flp/PilA
MRFFTYLWELAMKSIVSAITRFANDEGGVTAIEYGLIAALIGVVAISAMGDVGTALKDKFVDVAGKLSTTP